MNKEELKIWFRNKFNSCYQIIKEDYPKNIYMYYDEQFIRQKKLARILDQEIVYPDKPNGILLFEQDYKNGYLWMDYDEITTFFYNNYLSNWLKVKELIHGWLKEDTKLKVLTPDFILPFSKAELKEDTKLKVLTPEFQKLKTKMLLKEDTKLKVLTPNSFRHIEKTMLKEDTKLKVLTPDCFKLILK